MNGIYDLDSSDDTNAWNTHEIRSHRKPKRFRISHRAIAITLAAVVSTGALSSVHSEPNNVPAETSIALAVERPVSVSRSAVRKAPSRSARIEKTIKFAMAQRGDKYRWGAAGPNRWDCSGLVSVSFKKGAGVKLPHYTGGIQKKGKKVSKKNLKRGDIIFPQRGHVGIYLGNGKMVHASSGKGKVIVAKVYGFYTARRVL